MKTNRELIEKSMQGVREVPKKGFWIATKDGFKKVPGKKIQFPGYEGFDFFIWEHNLFLNLTEGKTGMAICEALREEATKRFKKVMSEDVQRGRKCLDDGILEAIKTNQLSPRWKNLANWQQTGEGKGEGDGNL